MLPFAHCWNWWKDRLPSFAFSVALSCPISFHWCWHSWCWWRKTCPSFTLRFVFQLRCRLHCWCWWKDWIPSFALSVALGCPVPFPCCVHFWWWWRNLCPSFVLRSVVQPFCCHPLLSFTLWRLVKGVLPLFCPLYYSQLCSPSVSATTPENRPENWILLALRRTRKTLPSLSCNDVSYHIVSVYISRISMVGSVGFCPFGQLN